MRPCVEERCAVCLRPIGDHAEHCLSASGSNAEAHPRLIVEVPIEGRAVAFASCSNFEEQQRLALELQARDLFDEIRDALVRLAVELAERREAA